MRLDAYLTANGLAKSRERAKELIQSGGVEINGKAAAKPSESVNDGDDVKITAVQSAYVGRGALKLEKAIDVFGISAQGKICADLGASTGGFTQCLLMNGAAKVYAVDVGHGQLDACLADDPRVVDMEGRDIRTLTAEELGGKPDIITCDVSFISLKLVLPVIAELLADDGTAVVLIKPQFECGRQDVGKRGIVRSGKVHERVINEILSAADLCGLCVDKADHSPICGGGGNIEYLALLTRKTPDRTAACVINAKDIVDTAFASLCGKGDTVR